MSKRNRFRDHVDPEYQRWGRIYPTFPGVAACVRLILDRKAIGAWADIIHQELAENASDHLSEIIETFHNHSSDDVGLYMVMALETAALPDSVEFFAELLCSSDMKFMSYAKRALVAIDTIEARTALYKSQSM